MAEEARHAVHGKKSDGNVKIKVKKIALWLGAAALFGILLIAAILTGGFGFGNKPETGKIPGSSVPDAATARGEVEIGDSPVKGAYGAPVSIIEFADFQCPFCGRFFEQTLPDIMKQYVDTGKVKFVYKHFPVEAIHPQALPAALASECAREQGKFWEYHDVIFKNQRSLGDESYRRWAKELNLDETEFDDCYDSKKYELRVRGDLEEGIAEGVRGTPGFLINGKLLSGSQPFAVFQQVIEAELTD